MSIQNDKKRNKLLLLWMGFEPATFYYIRGGGEVLDQTLLKAQKFVTFYVALHNHYN